MATSAADEVRREPVEGRADQGAAVRRRPFRFGLAPLETPTSKAAWQDLARKAEALGYAVLTVGDHMGRSAAPLPLLLSAADATTTLRVGTHVLANDFRNPAVLAKEAATLDLLTDGRLELGIGVGWPAGSAFASDYDEIGVTLAPPGTRLARLGEALRILRTYLTEDAPLDYRGTHYWVKGLLPYPRPAQRPGPPLMVAGAGPQLLRLAARYADIVNFAPRPPISGRTATGSVGFGLTVADQVDIVRQAAGDRFAAIELATFSMAPVVTDASDLGPVLDRFAAEYHTTPAIAREIPATLAGSVDALVERLQQHRDQLGLSYRIIGGGAMESFAPVVARLAGR
jgi:probable F420-dependent oxidoreductase